MGYVALAWLAICVAWPLLTYVGDLVRWLRDGRR
jgi:hypothetical protein